MGKCLSKSALKNCSELKEKQCVQSGFLKLKIKTEDLQSLQKRFGAMRQSLKVIDHHAVVTQLRKLKLITAFINARLYEMDDLQRKAAKNNSSASSEPGLN